VVAGVAEVVLVAAVSREEVAEAVLRHVAVVLVAGEVASPLEGEERGASAAALQVEAVAAGNPSSFEPFKSQSHFLCKGHKCWCQ